MTTIRLTTENLELIACTIETVRAEISDKFNFSQLLNAFIPHTWPPEFNDDETMSFTLQRLQSAPEDLGWWCWYFVLKDEITDARTLIGNGGFKGKPTPDGTVEIGYSVLQEFQNRGYATEAIQALISWAFEYPEIRQVIAETLPETQSLTTGFGKKPVYLCWKRF